MHHQLETLVLILSPWNWKSFLYQRKPCGKLVETLKRVRDWWLNKPELGAIPSFCRVSRLLKLLNILTTNHRSGGGSNSDPTVQLKCRTLPPHGRGRSGYETSATHTKVKSCYSIHPNSKTLTPKKAWRWDPMALWEMLEQIHNQWFTFLAIHENIYDHPFWFWLIYSCKKYNIFKGKSRLHCSEMNSQGYSEFE